MKLDLPQLRRLHELVARCSAALTPLAADGKGMDSEGACIDNVDSLLDRVALDLRMAVGIIDEEERK